MRKAEIYFKDHLAGILTETESGYEFCYNNDMHLKNFSLYAPKGKWFLTLAYDLLNVSMVNPKDTEELALTLNGRKKRMKKSDFVSAMTLSGITPKVFDNMLEKYRKLLPKVQIITDRKSIEKYGGIKIYFAPPIDYDRVMRKIPYGKVITVGKIRDYFAETSGADFTEPITAGIFVSIVAWASYQRSDDETPYWRTLKSNGELNAKYPNGVEAQKERLEAEGLLIIEKGRKNKRYYVKDYEKFLFNL